MGLWEVRIAQLHSPESNAPPAMGRHWCQNGRALSQRSLPEPSPTLPPPATHSPYPGVRNS